MLGRTLNIPSAANKVAWADYQYLCGQPLGAADYQAIAAHFTILVIDGVPCFTAEQRNETLRFITLIDMLYEHKVQAVIGAAAEPAALYPADGPLAFEFQRAVSRMLEMQSADYLLAAHLP